MLRIFKIKIFVLSVITVGLLFESFQVKAAGVCEASEDAHCYYIAPGGDDNNPGTFELPFASTNPIIDNLQPGDFVYFRGGVYEARNRGQIENHENNNRFVMAKLNNVNGNENNLITLKAYPNETPVIDLYKLNPEFNPTSLFGEPRDAFSVYRGSYIKIEGFEIIHGAIHLWSNPHHIWIENNHIHDLYTFRDNNGLILLHFAQNIYVYNNTLHDAYERGIPDPNNPDAPCNNGDHSGCILNTVKSHYDSGHNGCITTLSGDIYVGYGNETSGPFEFKGNNIYDCPARFFIKNPQGENVNNDGLNMLIENNYLHGMGYIFCTLRASNVLFINNLCKDSCQTAAVGSPKYPNGESGEEIINEIDARNITFRNNVFLDSSYFANIAGLGFQLENGIYSDDPDDKLKFENNIIFINEEVDPSEVNWNSHGHVFANSYRQPDLTISPIPSKVLSRISSRNNCYVNSLGENAVFLKQFLANSEGAIENVVGYDYETAKNNFGLDWVDDTFSNNLNTSLYLPMLTIVISH
jgi:hypothetical protein